MKLENRTMQILKNFAMINPSMLFREGSVQTTIAPQRNILARSTIKEEFPQEFAIFDLSRFLGVLSLFNEPEIDYDENRVLISQGRQKVAYTFADPELIVAPPSKTPNVQNPEVSFRLTTDNLGTNITIGVGKPSDPTSDTFKIEVGVSNHSFKFAFKAENIKILSGDYDVELSSKNISHFKGGDVEYWIMADANHSNFGN